VLRDSPARTERATLSSRARSWRASTHTAIADSSLLRPRNQDVLGPLEAHEQRHVDPLRGTAITRCGERGSAAACASRVT
jgi:hypothetical protein